MTDYPLVKIAVHNPRAEGLLLCGAPLAVGQMAAGRPLLSKVLSG